LLKQPARKGRKIGAKQPLAETWFFPLDLGPDFGESPFCYERISPVSTGITARHWRALLFVGFAFLLKMGRRDAATLPRIGGV